MSEFESDKAALLADVAEARTQLQGVVSQLGSDDLGRARRGSWSVSRILEHVLHSERLYAQLLSVFTGSGSSIEPGEAPRTSAEAIAALGATRQAVIDTVAEVEERDFYRLQTIGHEEYSVLSILENVANHDREHAEQISRTLAET